MAHVVTEKCNGCKFTDCVEVCPVACFYEMDTQVVIHADDCIDCMACVEVCPVHAIYADADVPTEYTKDIELADLINQRPQASIEEGGEFKFAETAVFDKLRVEGRNALVMRNNLGDVVASLSVELNGPVKDPVIEGRITATRGTLKFRNNPY